MTDIVERLRSWNNPDCSEADEIEGLRAANWPTTTPSSTPSARSRRNNIYPPNQCTFNQGNLQADIDKKIGAPHEAIRAGTADQVLHRLAAKPASAAAAPPARAAPAPAIAPAVAAPAPTPAASPPAAADAAAARQRNAVAT